MGKEYKTITYAYPTYPYEEDSSGFYFPDAIIDPIINALKPGLRHTFERHIALENEGTLPTLSRHKILIVEPKLSLEESFALVIRAFEAFDSRLGVMAREAIEDKSRWRLEKVEAGMAGGALINPNNEFNPTDRMIIGYQYDGTINDVIYIAHELGHLFAYDLGGAGDDEKRHMSEVQAFFTQSIMYHALMNGSSSVLKRAAEQHFAGEMTRGLYDVALGLAALEAEKMGTAPMMAGNRYDIIINDFLGPHSRRLVHAAYVEEHISEFKARDYGIGELHRHSMGGIIARALFDEALNAKPENRVKIVDALYGSKAKQGVYSVLDVAGISTPEQIQAFGTKGVEMGMQPLNQMPLTKKTMVPLAPGQTVFNKTA